MSILVLGTVALDTIKTPQAKKYEILGGSATHFAMAARFFTKVNLIANVGEDFPHKYIDFLKRKGLILTSLIKEKGKTFRWEGEYKQDFNTAITINTQLGVLSTFKPRLTKNQRKLKNVFLANLDPDLQSSLLDKLYSPKLVGLDSMNYWIKHKRASLIKLMKRVNIFFANDAEAKELSQEDNLLRAAKYLRSLGPQMIVIKKGEHGVLFINEKFKCSFPSYPIEEIIDPTGAGDTFAGGFMGYLAKNKRIDEAALRRAIVFGSIIASFNVEDFGLNKTAQINLQDIHNRFRSFKNLINL